MRDWTRPRRLAPAALTLALAACDPPRPAPQPDARAEVETQYERLAEAIRRGDLEAVLAVQAPDFTSRNPSGEAFDYAAMAEYTRRMTSAIDSVIHVRNRIREFTVRGDTAVADVCQEFSRVQRVGDSLRRVDTSALQTETWVRRPEGWRRRHVENVRGLRWFVEGVRIDPSQPYTPGAPEYRPDPDPPDRLW
jgi:ketosteroid isomerase-like protein